VVKSSSAADTGTAYLEGINAGTMRAQSVTMTGTTAASFAAASVQEVTDFYLSVAAVGTVTLYEDSDAGTALATITIGATRPRYYGFLLWPTPSAAVTYYVDYRRRVVDLVNGTDEPPVGEDVHPMFVAYAVMREAEKTGDTTLASQAKARYDTCLAKLKYQTQTLGDEIPVIGRGRRLGRSRLGGMYPADVYVRG